MLKLITDNKDAITILLAFLGGLLTFFAFIKAILEYKLQGRQKRAELFDKYKTKLQTDERIVKINSLLENDDNNLILIPKIDKYYFLGCYEEIAIAINSGLIKKQVAHYIFGYFALRCWESENFWRDVNKKSYYWSVFKEYVEKMQELENQNIEKNKILILWHKLTGQNQFKY